MSRSNAISRPRTLDCVRRAGFISKLRSPSGLVCSSWTVLLFAQPDAVTVAWCLGSLAGATLVAFCVQHDANHGAYFRPGAPITSSGGPPTRSSASELRVAREAQRRASHLHECRRLRRRHQRRPSPDSADPAEAKPWYRLQHLYVWPLYTLMGIRWQTLGDLNSIRQGSIGQSALRFPSGWTLAGLVGGKLFYITWAIVLPLLVYPWWAVASVYIGLSMAGSMVMAITFQLAHCVEEASFASPADVVSESRVWAVHEVETTVDFCPGNRLLTWALGGLNYQIEHHLFPQAPAHPLPRDRADCRAQLPAPRRALHGPAVAPSGGSLALPAPSRAGTCRAAGGARDGLNPG